MVKPAYLMENHPLYRYMQILENEYDDDGNLINKKINNSKSDILIGKKIVMSDPTKFNDVFECKTIMKATKQQKENLIYGIKKILDIKINERKIEQNIFELMGYRICCFTCDKNGDNHHELFWSHYAANNTGVCIVYDKDEIFSTINENKVGRLYLLYYIDDTGEEKSVECTCAIGEVDYSGKKIISFSNDGRLNEGFAFDEFVMRKGKVWSYEQEIRIVCYSNDFKANVNYYFKITPKCIREIRFGCCLDKKFCDEIVNMYNDIPNSIKFYKMDISDSELKLVPKEYI